jgi:hypothetical protein
MADVFAMLDSCTIYYVHRSPSVASGNAVCILLSSLPSTFAPVSAVSYWGWQQPLVEASNSFLNSLAENHLSSLIERTSGWSKRLSSLTPDCLWPPFFFITSSTPSADNSNLKSYHQLHSNLWFVSSKVHAGQWQTPFTMAGFWNPSHDRRA